MTLSKLLFEPTLLRSPLRVVHWWESRRLAFNGIVGTLGVATLLYGQTLSWLVRGELLGIPWQAIVAYGAAANVCYTSGWIVENVVERWLGRPVYGLGPALFRYGLAFSAGLTVLPAGLWTVMAIGGLLF